MQEQRNKRLFETVIKTSQEMSKNVEYKKKNYVNCLKELLNQHKFLLNKF